MADHIGHWAYALVIAGAVPAIAAAAKLSRHLNRWAALLIATVCGVGMLWLGLDSLPSTLCPDGFPQHGPPSWPEGSDRTSSTRNAQLIART